ncbi:DNA-processing protein DprA [Pseudomonas aeruginosa]|uniref:DNA-processing protein DprA n=1 Tax=Pseudomonas aeruginosa TaxID=287 RepID=UPI003FD47C1B|nr:DNA-protecting protein DprA [Pseudomonas aeruginosa]
MKNHSPAELEARLRLHGLPELGPMRFLRLIEAFGSASSALAAPAGAWRTLGVPAEAAAARRSPALLAEVADAPPLLYVEGAPETLERPQLAMVGSRRASPAGLGTARSFARSLAQGGFAITSGLALGIDGAAHEGALEAGGATVAVLGTGLRRLYPRRHEALARRIVEGGGALVSELPLDSPPLPANFPRRNRIISGLSLGVLVVEASPASGSLITARLAAEQGREVYAIPGSIHHPGARGCHQLIRDGALLVESVGHVLEALRGWAQAEPAEAPAQPLPHPLLALLRAAPYTSEGLAAASGMTLPDVLATLSELELDGRVACEAGTWVHRSG